MSLIEFLLAANGILLALLLLELIRFRKMFTSLGNVFFSMTEALVHYMNMKVAQGVAEDMLQKVKEFSVRTKEKQNGR